MIVKSPNLKKVRKVVFQSPEFVHHILCLMSPDLALTALCGNLLVVFEKKEATWYKQFERKKGSRVHEDLAGRKN